MGFFDKFLNGISSYAQETQQAYAEERENMKYKTDAQLKKLATEGGSSARAMGIKKAALEELRSRGYNV